MKIDEFRERGRITIIKSEPAAQPVQPPVTEKVVEAEVVEPSAEAKEEDLEYSWELEQDDLDELKKTYEFFDKVLDGLLKAEIHMPIKLVEEFENIMANLHTLINEFTEYKPEEVGVPCIAVTLMDEARETRGSNVDICV